MKNVIRLTVLKTSIFLLAGLSFFLPSGCSEVQSKTAATGVIITQEESVASPTTPPAPPAMADAATIINRQEVPILCYHQVRDYRASDSKTARDYIVPPDVFRQQMKSLADSGYHTILPDQLNEYLLTGRELPSKPVVITFDDTRVDQYSVALPELNKYGYKGAFFIMTVSLGRPGYMSKEQVKQLADEGHSIGSHTWNHKNIKTYVAEDWATQIQEPSRQLQSITGKPVDFFAYPFGLWNRDAIVKLKEHGFKAVFQLSAKRDPDDPLFTIRRIIVPGTWSGATMQRCMKNTFKL
jgi:peptidoglycan/xylan/chitin deacetylase (PgdA/CDA1 family)